MTNAMRTILREALWRRGRGTARGVYLVVHAITAVLMLVSADLAQGQTKFYFHNVTTPDTGTLPGATTLSATTPDVTAAGAGTNRDMDQTIGTVQVSAALSTLGQTALQKNWFRRFLSRPLAAQTLPTGVWTIQGGASENNTGSNMLLWGAVIKVWRPSTGTTVATLLDDPALGTVEPGTAETNISKATASITGVAINDGDILVVELWAQNTQGATNVRTNTIFYDGTTEGSTSSNAAFLQAPGTITIARTLTQSAYRLFDNANSTDVGTALAAQDTAATLGSAGAAFRLRMLVHVANQNLGTNGQAFKLQFAARSGTCDTAFSGETYADVTTTSAIAYNNNATPADGATLTANANDPTHGADTVVNQTYEELNNFTNPAAINSGRDGKWDFALKDNGAPAGTTYCFRVVKDTGAVLDIYSVIPEITTASRTFSQSAYRLFDNANSTDVGTALAAQNTAATLGATGIPFRLRVLVHVGVLNLGISGQAFKLQFAARSGTCDTAFSGETYADVTTTSAIAYNNNATPADGANLTANANDPTHGADTVVNQTYEELNNFTNPAAINSGQDGKWDFALVDNGAADSTAYCFRVVDNTGALLDTYSVIPEITTAPRGTIFYFHDATTPNDGTLPAATTLSATTPDVTAAGAGTNRDMDQTIGTAQVSTTLTTLGQTALQENWFRRFLSRPLAAQTLPTGAWTIQGAASESNAASNMLLWGAVIKVWRPSTGATVATLLDDPALGTVEPGGGETVVSNATASITGVAVNDGDILVVELWAQNTQGNTTARTNTIFYDGTTEGSNKSNAAFLQAPAPIAFYRSLRQSAYRLFDNANSTDVGTALAAQDTAATLGATGAAFRLRMLLHVADINLGTSGQAFKLQFAARSGTCDTGFSGETYADVTAATVIAYNNNATPADGANLTNNANDPTHSGHTLRNQTYEELNNFTNSVAAINSGEDGKWDFALRDNGATASTAYCFRAVKSTGAVLDTYIVIPEITTAPAVPTPGSFNAFETSTAAGAITGVIKTKVAGSAFSLDVVAIAAGVQQAGFTDAVIVELRGNNTLGVALDAQNCPTSSTLVQTVAPDPTITGGRSTVNFAAVANSWRDVRVRVRWPTTSPTVTWCSTDNFAIRPNTFASLAVTDTDWQTTGTPGARALNLLTFAATTPLHKAGRPFSVRATAVNTTAATTGNYTGAPNATLSTCAGAACTATFGTLTLATTFAAGQLASDVASYDNVGSFRLELVDSSFASVDAGDSSALEREIRSGTIDVGRFVPDHFAVALNAPVFGTACGSFSYIGQAFNYTTAPAITVTAEGFANNTTTLYAGAWSRITNSTVTPATQAARYSRFDALGGGTTPALDPAGLPLPAGDPAIGVFTNGVGALTFSSGTGGLGFVRSTTTPNAPFNADIALALDVIDTDSVAYASNPAAFGTATANNGIAFSSGKPMRFGRLRLDNAVGSGNLDLPIPIQTQYWNGTAFQTNGADNCTSISAANIEFSNYFGGISAANMNSANISGLGGPFTSGVGSLKLTKPLPAPGSPGAVTLTVNLTAEAKSYLKGNWGVPTFTADPTSRAAFGLYGSQPKNFIFFRENY